MGEKKDLEKERLLEQVVASIAGYNMLLVSGNLGSPKFKRYVPMARRLVKDMTVLDSSAKAKLSDVVGSMRLALDKVGWEGTVPAAFLPDWIKNVEEVSRG